MYKQTEVFLKLLEVTKLNQTEFAKLTEKSSQRISEWKTGKVIPSFKQLELMAEKLGYSLNVIVEKKK